LINFSIGLIELIAAAGLLFYEDHLERTTYVQILLWVLTFDSFLMHFPFSELDKNFEKEMSHFTHNIGIAGALLMAAGFRNQ